MKKVFALLLLFFVGLTFVGCSSATKLSAINTKISSIFFVVDLGAQNLDEYEKDEQEVVKTKTENLAQNYSSLIKIRYFETLSNLELSGKISSNQKVLYKNHLTSKIYWNKSSCVIEFEFYSQTASRIFLTNSDYSGAINQERAFETVTTEKFKNVFSKTINNTVINLEEYFLNGINESISGIGGKELEKIGLYYMFLSENSKLRSQNANEILTTGDGSIFCFYSNENDEIEFDFYVVQANVLAYYLLALGIVFVFIVAYLVVVLIVRKNKKQKLKKELDSNLENKES